MIRISKLKESGTPIVGLVIAQAEGNREHVYVIVESGNGNITVTRLSDVEEHMTVNIFSIADVEYCVVKNRERAQKQYSQRWKKIAEQYPDITWT